MSAAALFLHPLDSRDLEGGAAYELLALLGYYSPILARLGLGDAGPFGPAGHVTMPASFVCDSYSVPAWCWFCVRLVYRLDRRPAFLHDWLCSGKVIGVTREIADRVIREAMGSVGIAAWKKRWIFRGVRFGDHFNIGGQGYATEIHDADSPVDHSPGA